MERLTASSHFNLKGLVLLLGLFGSFILISLYPVSAIADNGYIDDLTRQSRVQAKMLGGSLKRVLITELNQNGAVGALEVCHSQAQPITDQHNNGGWEVRRTALKVRNPENQADEWETQVLTDFEAQIENGVKPELLEYSEVTAGEFRYMKAIPMGAVCSACHGHSIAPRLADAISSYYPEDQATGFDLGSLRGAFSIRTKLNSTVSAE